MIMRYISNERYRDSINEKWREILLMRSGERDILAMRDIEKYILKLRDGERF